MAEHMLILKLTNPEGKSKYIAGAFPSACGKTNLAMLMPTIPGWKAETIGDDICWMKFGADGRLYAINPETGFFGVAPGTCDGVELQRHADALRQLHLLQLRADRRRRRVVGRDDGEEPAHTDRLAAPPVDAVFGAPAAHPNARFTTPAAQCPVIAKEWEDPKGVPIDAILFGGRRATVVPLVTEALNWVHGTFLGAIGVGEDCGRGRQDRRRFAAIPWPCCRSAATTWATTSLTG